MQQCIHTIIILLNLNHPVVEESPKAQPICVLKNFIVLFYFHIGMGREDCGI